MARAGVLREYTPERNTMAFLLSSDSEDDRRFREDLLVSAQLGSETARMELLEMPATGWAVDIESRICPCRLW